MRLTISAPSLNKPTYETLEEYANKRFKKIEKLLRKKQDTDHELRISAKKTGDFFELSAEVFIPVSIIAKSKDRDLRKAIDTSVDQLKRQLKEGHRKTVDKRISRNRVVKKIRSITSNFFE
jgi:ribosome-associated translation inhibitor RaiA